MRETLAFGAEGRRIAAGRGTPFAVKRNGTGRGTERGGSISFGSPRLGNQPLTVPLSALQGEGASTRRFSFAHYAALIALASPMR